MKISVIIPIYNVEPYVEQCLRSVMAQTHWPLECILVDDCGTDGSMAVVRRMLADYRGGISFLVLAHQQNQGLSVARNTGLAAATGDYVLFIDSDDWLPDDQSIALLAARAAEWPEVEMVQGSAYTQPQDQEIDHFLAVGPERVPEHLCCNDDVRRYYFRYYGSKWPYGLPVNSWNKLLRRDFLLENQMGFEPGLLHEDVLFMHQLACKVQKAAFVRETTYYYRIRPDSITTIAREQRYRHWNKLLTLIARQMEGKYYRQQYFRYYWDFMVRYSLLPRFSLWKSTWTIFLVKALRHGYVDALLLQLLATCTLAFGKGRRLIPQTTKKLIKARGIME